MAEIEEVNDVEAKRHIVEMLVADILVTNTGTGKGKSASVRVSYTFAPRREETATPTHQSLSPCSRKELQSGLSLSIPGTES